MAFDICARDVHADVPLRGWSGIARTGGVWVPEVSTSLSASVLAPYGFARWSECFFITTPCAFRQMYLLFFSKPSMLKVSRAVGQMKLKRIWTVQLNGTVLESPVSI